LIRKAIRASLCLAGLVVAGNALAEDPKFGLNISSDIRADVDRVDKPGFSRNENRVEGKVSYKANEHIELVAALDAVFIGFTQDNKLMGLTDRTNVDPFRLESDAAYVDLLDIAKGLDMRIGRQIVQWGAADMINPTDNVCPDDLSDPLKFGKNIANQMIKVDYSPWGSMTFTAIWVPVFRPAQLPVSVNAAMTDATNEFPFASPQARARGENLRAIWLDNPDTYDLRTPDVDVDVPDFSFDNSQVALKAEWEAGGWDMSLSYYKGFDDMPVLIDVKSTVDVMEGEKLGVNSAVKMAYPRMQVLGFDLSGQLPFLDNMGFWVEGAVIFPEKKLLSIDLTGVVPGAEVITSPVVDDNPFFKATVGADYTPISWMMLNVQYVRGFIDEFGAYALGNYMVGVVDTKFLSDRLGIRVAGITQLPRKDDDIDLPDPALGLTRDSPSYGAHDNGYITSYVFFPQVMVNPWGALEIIGGGYFLFGPKESKFGQIGAGSSLVFLKAQVGF